MPASELHRAFGERVRELRTERGLSQEALAHLAGINRTYLGDVERGERNIALENIAKLAAALRVSLPTLLTSRALEAQAKRLASHTIAKARRR